MSSLVCTESRGTNHRSITLACFSPPVMLATFAIEFALAAYTWLRYGRRPFGRLAAVMLVLLGVFQVSEYAICTTAQQYPWIVAGWIAITFLPAIGVHLVASLTRPTAWVPFGYGIALVLALTIVAIPTVVTTASCTGQFVTFATETVFSRAYAIYYLGYLALGIVMLSRSLIHHRGPRRLEFWMLIGYLAFLIPTGITYFIVEQTRTAIPSIMCGFAVMLALILAFRILPLERKRR